MTEEIKKLTTGVEFIRENGVITAYVRAAERTLASAKLGENPIAAISNLREPFDFRMHIFALPEQEFESIGKFTVIYTQRGKRPSNFFTEPGQKIAEEIAFSAENVKTAEFAQNRSDRGLSLKEITEEGACGGLSWKCMRYQTPDGSDVRVYTMIADPEKVGFLCGTPHCLPEFREKDIQTVMEEARAAEETGLCVLGAANGDFFDMFGNCAPSGLCVTQGICVANPDSPNPFFGIRRDGTAVIGFLREYPLEELAEAVGGGQIIVRDGKMYETAPLQPFGEITHPRTAYGIRKDGKVLVTVVDGRRPSWSNGAALSELAKLMIAEGAEIALNTDGGGSSTFIVKKEGELRMLNHPADLVRPMEDLVRPLFDSLILYNKEEKC